MFFQFIHFVNLLILVLWLQVWLSRNIGKSLVKLSKKHREHLIYNHFIMTSKSCRDTQNVGFLRCVKYDYGYHASFRSYYHAPSLINMKEPWYGKVIIPYSRLFCYWFYTVGAESIKRSNSFLLIWTRLPFMRKKSAVDYIKPFSIKLLCPARRVVFTQNTCFLKMRYYILNFDGTITKKCVYWFI